MPISQSLAGTLDLLQDIARLGCPDERLRCPVVVIDIVKNSHDQLLYVPEDAAANALVGEIAEEALHHIEPRTTRRSEMHVDARMTCQPALHLGMLVRGIVVGDQVKLLLWRSEIVDHA